MFAQSVVVEVDRNGDDLGALVVSLLPDDPTLQFGPGGIGEGIANAIDRPVNIWSGLVTEAMASLDDRDCSSVERPPQTHGAAIRSDNCLRLDVFAFDRRPVNHRPALDEYTWHLEHRQ